MDDPVHQLVANLSQWADAEWPLHPNTYTVRKLLAISTSVSLVPLQGLPEMLYSPLEIPNFSSDTVSHIHFIYCIY